jgi:protein involved in polysaccharide export with SLBB domain
VKEGDELFIPETNNNVFIYGEVSTEGTVMFEPNKDLQYYVDKSGGLKKYADSKSIYILHPNGETQRYSSKRNIFENKPKGDIEIYPGSVIFIPRKLDESTGRRLATQAYVSILGNLGIALASLSSISNNN